MGASGSADARDLTALEALTPVLGIILKRRRSSTLSEYTPPEVVQNQAIFNSMAAVSEFSVYRLFPEEKFLFARYYRPGQSVLDLACGLGRTTLLLHEMGMVVRGIDRAELLIQTAKRRLPYLDLKVGSYESIDEPDSTFSHVLISFNGIDYAFPAAQRLTALHECARVLKPGGTLIYSSHNLKSLHWYSPYYRRRLRWKVRNTLKAFKEWDYVLEDGVHTFYASSRFVVRQTEEVGLNLLEIRGFCRLENEPIDRYFSPYIHYVFSKPTP